MRQAIVAAQQQARRRGDQRAGILNRDEALRGKYEKPAERREVLPAKAEAWIARREGNEPVESAEGTPAGEGKCQELPREFAPGWCRQSVRRPHAD